jgi:hypothetical protein
MTDTTVPGRNKPDLIDNGVRVLTRSPNNRQIILQGTAASPVTTSFGRTPSPELVDNGTKWITRSPGGYLLGILSVYPGDVVTGFDNFDGWPTTEPFNQQQSHASLIPVLKSYAAYNAGTDIIYSQFRRKPFFGPQDEYAQAATINPFLSAPQGHSVINGGGGVIPPVYPIDLIGIYKPRQNQANFLPNEYNQTEKGAWHIVLMPTLAPQPIPPFYGAGPIIGEISCATILGEFSN